MLKRWFKKVPGLVPVARACQSGLVQAFSWLATGLAAVLARPWERRAAGRPDPPAVREAVIVRLDQIGDLVLFTPFLRELRRLLPKARLRLVVRPLVLALVERCPYVDEVIAWEPGTAGFWALARRLRRTRPDLCLVPRWDQDKYGASWLAFLSRATWRLAWSEKVTPQKARRNRGYDRLFTQVLDQRGPCHESERNLEMIRWLGGDPRPGLEFWPSEEDENFARAFLKPGPAPWVALAPGAGAANRKWPLESFIDVGRWLRAEYGAGVAFIGGPDDRGLAEAMSAALADLRVPDLSRLTLRQAGALLKHCSLLVCNDSGLGHLGAAAGCGVVAVFSSHAGASPLCSSAPERFAPLAVRLGVARPAAPQAPCRDDCEAPLPHCILGVTPEQVKDLVRRQLGAPHPS